MDERLSYQTLAVFSKFLYRFVHLTDFTTDDHSKNGQPFVHHCFDKLWSMNNGVAKLLGLCNPKYHCIFPILRCISQLNVYPLYVSLSNIYCSTVGLSPANLSFRYTWLLSWFHSFNDNIRTSINAILAYFWISERITIQISLYKRASKCAYR